MIDFLYISIFFFIAGIFNGNADQIVFDAEDNPNDDSVWFHILKGWLLDWFRGDYKQYVRDRWWIHSIFMDGWHFFKNLWVLTFLVMAVWILVYSDIEIDSFWSSKIFIAFVLFSFSWKGGKQLMHGKLASWSWWNDK